MRLRFIRQRDNKIHLTIQSKKNLFRSLVSVNMRLGFTRQRDSKIHPTIQSNERSISYVRTLCEAMDLKENS